MGNAVAVLMRKAPYGSVYTAEGFRTLMGIAVFEMDIRVIFMDDGVFGLLKGQDPAKLDMKPLGDGFPMLADFGVQQFFVHERSLTERGLTVEDLVVPATLVDGPAIGRLLAEAGKVLSF